MYHLKRCVNLMTVEYIFQLAQLCQSWRNGIQYQNSVDCIIQITTGWGPGTSAGCKSSRSVSVPPMVLVLGTLPDSDVTWQHGQRKAGALMSTPGEMCMWKELKVKFLSVDCMKGNWRPSSPLQRRKKVGLCLVDLSTSHRWLLTIVHWADVLANMGSHRLRHD